MLNASTCPFGSFRGMFLSHPTAPCLRTPSSLGRMVRRAARVRHCRALMLITNVAAAVAVDAAAAAAAALPAITLSVGSSLDKISTLRTPFWSETIGVPFGRPSSGLTSVLSEIQKHHPTSGKQSICLGEPSLLVHLTQTKTQSILGALSRRDFVSYDTSNSAAACRMLHAGRSQSVICSSPAATVRFRTVRPMYITRAPVACKRMGGCELLSHLPQSSAPQQQERHLQVRSDEYPDASGPEDSYCDLLLAARHQVLKPDLNPLLEPVRARELRT